MVEFQNGGIGRPGPLAQLHAIQGGLKPKHGVEHVQILSLRMEALIVVNPFRNPILSHVIRDTVSLVPQAVVNVHHQVLAVQEREIVIQIMNAQEP